MKRINFIFIMLIISIAGKAQFRAVMENVISGDKNIYTVFSDKTHYRYELTQDGQKMIIIVDPGANKTRILLPDKRFYLQVPCNSMMSLENDPVQSYAMLKSHYTEKDAGKEDVAGFACDKKEIYADNDKVITAWIAEALNFPVKMINHLNENTYMNLKDISEWQPDESLFKTPDGYTQVDERMRPVIPEPPAPEKWTVKRVQLPFHGDVSRGEILVFTIDKTAHYKVIVENKTDKPAKMIRYFFKDGKEAPEKIEGPERFRTTRLYSGEKVPETLILDPGYDIHFNVFEGTMLFDIHEEE